MNVIEVLSVPVYAESRSVFERKKAAKIAQLTPDGIRAKTRMSFEIGMDQEIGCWHFNRVVGWLRVSAEAGDLRIDVYRSRATRLRSNSRFIYELVSPKADSICEDHPHAIDLSSWLPASLREITKTWFPRRWIDWRSTQSVIESLRIDSILKNGRERR